MLDLFSEKGSGFLFAEPFMLLSGLKNVYDFGLLFADQTFAVGLVGTILVGWEEVGRFGILKFIVHFILLYLVNKWILMKLNENIW